MSAVETLDSRSDSHGALDVREERERLAEALVTAMAELESDRDSTRLLQSFADLLVAATPHFRLTWFYIGDPQAEIIRPDYCAGPERDYGDELRVDRSRTMMRGPVRRALGDGEPSIWNIPRQLAPWQRLIPGVGRYHAEAMKRGVRAALALPFQIPNSTDWGLTLVYADTIGYFDAVGLEPFRALSRLVQVGLDRIGLREAERRSRDDLDRVRRQDPLTGLANRQGFESALHDRQGQAPRDWLLLQVDLDDFGALNAGGGEALGDAVLTRTAERLTAFAGDSGLVARSGADEFLLALPGPAAEAEASAEACQAAIMEPLVVDGERLALSAAIGVTTAAADERDTLIDRQRELAVAVGQARSAGAGAHCVYRRELEVARGVPQGLLAAVRSAMADNELLLWYQPQVGIDLAQPRLTGVEALLRWQRSDGRMVSPGEFIPAVEGSALIRDIGNWVIGEALAQSMRWREESPASIGVNVGARHLLHPRFTEDVERLLHGYAEVPPGVLTIEITETAALDDLEHACRVLGRLRELGLRIALDDFGTGHASLSHLQSLPLDYIKIDRSFVDGIDRDPGRLAIVDGLLSTARGLGLGVVAEGVEQHTEVLTLAALGCRIVQGFHFARPMPAAQLDDWVGETGRALDTDALPANRPALAAVQRLLVRLAAGEAHAGLALPKWLREWLRAVGPDAHDVTAADQALTAVQAAPADPSRRQRATAELEALREALRTHARAQTLGLDG